MKLLTDEQHAALYSRLERLVSRSGCTHSLRRTRTWLQAQDVDVRANIEKIVDLGGHCDCEVLMNVTPDVWQANRDEALVYPTIMGAGQSSSFVSHTMLQAVQGTLRGPKSQDATTQRVQHAVQETLWDGGEHEA